MAKFVKVAIEGRRCVGQGFTKPVSNPRVKGMDLGDTASRLCAFFGSLQKAMGAERFGDRAQIFRTAHALEAIAAAVRDGSSAAQDAVDRHPTRHPTKRVPSRGSHLIPSRQSGSRPAVRIASAPPVPFLSAQPAARKTRCFKMVLRAQLVTTLLHDGPISFSFSRFSGGW